MDDKIKELAIKGFSKEEIAKMLKIKLEEINIEEKDITSNSEELYSALQKDLSKLVLTEMTKENRDTQVILNSIKLQAELQEKKLSLRKVTDVKISKSYIYDRDDEIVNLKKTMTDKEIAEKLNIGVLSVKQAIDRNSLNLPDELKTLSPTIISETKGLKKEVRLKVLKDAYENNLKRKEIRDIVNKIKNKTR
jgi:DNA-binding CsgD family transcriptional regulator